MTPPIVATCTMIPTLILDDDDWKASLRRGLTQSEFPDLERQSRGQPGFRVSG